MDKGSSMTFQISKLEGSSLEKYGETPFKDIYVVGTDTQEYPGYCGNQRYG